MALTPASESWVWFFFGIELLSIEVSLLERGAVRVFFFCPHLLVCRREVLGDGGRVS